MILIIGGKASGKKTFAKTLGYFEEDMDDACLGNGRVLYNLQELLRDKPNNNNTLIDAMGKYEVVICTEVGSGIVPLSAEERAWRDQVGRTCTHIAEQASCVIRMVCGIPIVLKGELP